MKTRNKEYDVKPKNNNKNYNKKIETYEDYLISRIDKKGRLWNNNK
tara:strand:- start:473 stop:610 length:138 start_codon:yes stop_codon:yes gene_type:complete